MTNWTTALLEISDHIRYAAVYRGGQLEMASRTGRASASAAESDRYEELIVNPTLLTLVRQRGEIDCGGMEYVVVRYGNFFQLVMPVPGGHASICIEPDADPLALVAPVRQALAVLEA